jgi:hypothetical protein
LHKQPQIHYGRDFLIESVPLDLLSNREGGIAQLIQTIRYGEHGWDGVGGSSVVPYAPNFCLGSLFTILSGLAEKWLIALGQSPSVK